MSNFSNLAKKYQDASDRLEKARKAYEDAHAEAQALWAQVMAAGPAPMNLNGDAPAGTKAKASKGRKKRTVKGTKKAAKRSPRASFDWAAIRESLYAGMSEGTLYSGDELQALVSYKGNYRNWIRNVVASLHDDGYLEKQGQTRNTRWKKVS